MRSHPEFYSLFWPELRSRWPSLPLGAGARRRAHEVEYSYDGAPSGRFRGVFGHMTFCGGGLARRLTVEFYADAQERTEWSPFLASLNGQVLPFEFIVAEEPGTQNGRRRAFLTDEMDLAEMYRRKEELLGSASTAYGAIRRYL
jgi:hypothetical protein